MLEKLMAACMLSTAYAGAQTDKTSTSKVHTVSDYDDRCQASSIVGGNHRSMNPCVQAMRPFSKQFIVDNAPANYAPAAYYALLAARPELFEKTVPFSEIEKQSCYRAIDGFYLPALLETSGWRQAAFYDVSSVIDPQVPTFIGIRPRTNRDDFDAEHDVVFYFNANAVYESARWCSFSLVAWIMLGEGGVLAPTLWIYPERVSALQGSARFGRVGKPLFEIRGPDQDVLLVVQKALNDFFKKVCNRYLSFARSNSDINADEMTRFASYVSDLGKTLFSLPEGVEMFPYKGYASPSDTGQRAVTHAISEAYGTIVAKWDTEQINMAAFATLVCYYNAVGMLNFGAATELTEALASIPTYRSAFDLIGRVSETSVTLHRAEDSESSWAALDDANPDYIDSLRKTLVDKAQLTESYAWDHSATIGSVVPCAPLFLLFRLERCIFDSLTTIITTVKGAAMRGGLSTGIFPLLQLSSWAESIGWYAPSSEDDAFMAAELDAQYAGQSGFLQKVRGTVSSKRTRGLKEISRSFWSGIVGSSRRFFGRSVDFVIAASETINSHSWRVTVYGLRAFAVKVVEIDAASGELVTRPGSITITEYDKSTPAGVNAPYSRRTSDRIIRLVPLGKRMKKQFADLLDAVGDPIGE